MRKSKKKNTSMGPKLYGSLDNIKAKYSKPKKKKPVFLFITLALLAVVVGGFGFFKLWAVPPAPPPQVLNTPAFDGNPPPLPESSEEQETAPAEAPDKPDVNAGKYTFVVVGMDKVSKSTDAVLLIMFDTANHKVNVISVPRDTLINIPENVKKINTLYAYGEKESVGKGIERLMDGIRDFVGFDIGSFVIVNLQAFEQLIDAIGGVDYYVPRSMYYYDGSQGLKISIPMGMQHLNGRNALKVMRFRSGYANADIGRIGTQQDLMKTVAKKILTAQNIPNLPEIIRIITENTETNLTAANITYFATQLLKCSIEDINFYTLPANTNNSIRGLSYVTVYVDDWIDMINAYLNPLDQPVTARNVNLLTKTASGGFYSTTGQIAGGANSFLVYD